MFLSLSTQSNTFAGSATASYFDALFVDRQDKTFAPARAPLQKDVQGKTRYKAAKMMRAEHTYAGSSDEIGHASWQTR
jgi:hypothetical protein